MSWLWILIWIFATQQRAGPPAPRGVPSEGRASLSGKVAMSGTGDPIPNVAVTLQPSGVATVTDGMGRFRLIGPSGRYTMTIERDGFVLEPNPLRGISEFGMPITLDSDDARDNLTFSMLPAPTISGHTYLPNGDPLAAAVVQAYRWRYTPYGRRMRIARTALTDDSGEFRLYWLRFGEYLVSASYSRLARSAALGPIRLSPNVSDPDDGFATVFYGGATNLADAEKIRLAPGTPSSGFNIAFRDVARFKIRGRIIPPGDMPSDIKLIIVPEGSAIVPEDRSSTVSVESNGTFEVGGLSPGSYAMLATSASLGSDLVTISVADADIDNLRIPLVPTATVIGRVVLSANLRANLDELKVSLVRTRREVDLRYQTNVAADGTFTLRGVGPGIFDAFIDSLPPGAYARSIRYAGRDALSNGLDVNPNSNPLEIVLATGSVAQGRVLDRKGDPVPGTTIVLVPDRQFRRRPDRYIVGFSDSRGTFQLNNVPPGRYSAFAFERIESEAYFAFGYDPSVEQRFANRAMRINVIENQIATFDLTIVPASETAGGL